MSKPFRHPLLSAGLAVCAKWKMAGFPRTFSTVNLPLAKDPEVDPKLQYLDVCRHDTCRKSLRHFNVLKHRDGKTWQPTAAAGDAWSRNS